MIQPASEEYLDEILAIEREAFSQPWTYHHFKNDLLRNVLSENWVGLDNNNVIAYVFGWLVSGEYHLNNIAVHCDYREKGIGKRVLTNVIEKIRKLNVHTMFLEVSASNLPARKLYESNGFEAVGERKDYYTKGDDAVLYILRLK